MFRFVHQTCCIGAAALISTLSQAAPATMLGDSLVFMRAFPTASTPYVIWDPSSVTTTASSGTGDVINWVVQGFQTIIDPDATSIDFRFPVVSSFGDPSGAPSIGFDGFVVSGFGHDIDAVTLLGNDSALSISLSHAAREVFIDLDGINAGGATGFSISIGFVDPSVVPVPSTPLLAIAGLALAGARRRKWV